MGKSNNSSNESKEVYEKENNCSFFSKKDKITTLKGYEIEILENINNFFSKEFIDLFFSFTKNTMKLVSYNTRIGSCNADDKIIKNARCLNLLEILPYKNQSFIIFSYDFLSIVIDVLFGGGGSVINKNRKIKDMTSTETLINKKIIKFITISLSKIYKKYFSSEINFINKKTFFDFKTSNFNINTVFLINRFNFNVKSVEVFFNLLIPISILKHINKKIVLSLSNNYKDTYIEKNVENKISFNDIYNVELNIISNIIDVSILYNKLYNLSIGDVLLIKKPDSITGFIEGKAIFFGKYKRFNEQSIVFIEEFINNNLESNQDKDALMSDIKKHSDSKKLIDSENNISESQKIKKNLLFQENLNENELNNSKNSIDSKHVLLNTYVKITVELGKSKIKIKDFLKFSKGSMLILDKSIKEPLDVFINGHLIASGEIVVLEKKYGLRITSIKNSLKNIKSVS